jgi:histidinol dehydrogenase
VLPTGGAARRKGGLSVLDFLRVRTWLQLDDARDARDAAALARLEGLEAHARAAERRDPARP